MIFSKKEIVLAYTVEKCPKCESHASEISLRVMFYLQFLLNALFVMALLLLKKYLAKF